MSEEIITVVLVGSFLFFFPFIFYVETEIKCDVFGDEHDGYAHLTFEEFYAFAMKALYPDLMNERCSLPEFVGLPCIFESCQLCWQACNGRYTEALT